MAAEQSAGTGLIVDVVTPTGQVARTETDAVTAPGELGYLEVFPGHVPFVTELHAGVLTLSEKGNKTVYAVGPGFLEVAPTGDIRVLVERAVAGENADTDEAKAELKETQPALAAWKDGLTADYRTLKARNDWAQAQLDAHGAASGKSN